jgi:uncharacterized RDD family membrane protein YckC
VFCSQCGTENSPDARFCSACGLALNDLNAISSRPPHFGQPPPRISVAYAGFWQRALALLIDSMIGMLAVSLFSMPLGMLAAHSLFYNTPSLWMLGASLSMSNLAGMLFFWLYFTLMESGPWQATIGKRALGLKVTDEDGRRISWGRANARYWGKILSMIMGIGYLMVAFTSKKQGLHDKLAATLVFSDNK